MKFSYIDVSYPTFMRKIMPALLALFAFLNANAQTVYFVKQKSDDLRKATMFQMFRPGDPFIGLLFLKNEELDYHPLGDYIDEKKGVVPIDIEYFSKKKNYLDHISMEIPIANGAVTGEYKRNAIYFQILPASPEALTPEQLALLNAFAESPAAEFVMNITVGAGPGYVMDAQGKEKVSFNLTEGIGPYAAWLKPSQESASKKQAADFQKWLEDSDKLSLPKAKMIDPALEKEAFNFLTLHYSEIHLYKIIIESEDWYYDKHPTSGALQGRSIWVSMAYKHKNGYCYTAPVKLYQQFVTGTQYSKFRIAEDRDPQIYKCERIIVLK